VNESTTPAEFVAECWKCGEPREPRPRGGFRTCPCRHRQGTAHLNQDGKERHAYVSRDSAITGMLHRARQTGQSATIYQCPECNAWHHGAQPLTADLVRRSPGA